MATTRPFDEYQIRLHGSGATPPASLLCYYQGILVGRVDFHADASALPQDHLSHPAADLVIVLNMPVDRLDAVLATVRQEGPLSLYIDVDPSAGTSATPGHGYLATADLEPVGEQEGAPSGQGGAAGPILDHLVYWGTADPDHIVPQNEWAVQFGPGYECLYPTSPTAFVGNADFTVATWVKPSAVSARVARDGSVEESPFSQFNMNNVNERRFFFRYDYDPSDSYVQFMVYEQNHADWDMLTTRNDTRLNWLDPDQWYRLVGIHDKTQGQVSFYINDLLIGELAWPHGVGTGQGQQPWIGARSRGGAGPRLGWRGQIGPTCYYQRAWTRQEITWDYHGGQGRHYEELGVAGNDGANLLDGLVAFWPLTEEDTGAGAYVTRRDAHLDHHLASLPPSGQSAFASAPGVLPKTGPIADDERVHQLTDRSPLGNSMAQADNALRPYWDAASQAVSIEQGAVLANSHFTGLAGLKLALYLTSILKDSSESEPWLQLSYPAAQSGGVKIFRAGDALVVKAWIGGSVHELSFALSFPAERLVEVHYDGQRLSLWSNGQLQGEVAAAGPIDGGLNRLQLGPEQGLKELLVYDEAHR